MVLRSLTSMSLPGAIFPTTHKPKTSLLHFTRSRFRQATSLSTGALKTTLTCCATAPTRRPEYVPNRISDPNYVRIFDTTLRDGEQAPGAAMTSKEKLVIARQLAELGVDVIEAGFPGASKDEFEAVKSIAESVGNAVSADGYVPVICGLARCHEKDIETAWQAVKHAKLPKIHTFIATSEIHIKYKLRKTKEEVIELARSMVRFARSLGCHDVEFSPEDAGRSDREFLYQILGEVIKAGATTVNIPDTVGYTFPFEFGKLIADIKANTPGIENVILSAHCHDDLGLSTANTIAAASAGARQVQVTVNGIGERAGNASLEEVVMALKCRGNDVLGGLYSGINIRHIAVTSKMVEEYSGLNVQPHKAIVGANAFAHQSGIHQDGMLKHKGTYEIISPEEIGLQRTNNSGIVLGKLSGRHALKMALKELGYEVDGEELQDIFWRFKAVAATKKIVSKADLAAFVPDRPFQPQVAWQLKDLQVTCGTPGQSTAIVKLVSSADWKVHIASSVGTGPVDSAYKAVDLIVKVPVTLIEYYVHAKTEGIAAKAITRVVIRGENMHTSNHVFAGETIHETFSGSGTSMDMVVSGVKAYIEALNNILWFKNQCLSEPTK